MTHDLIFSGWSQSKRLRVLKGPSRRIVSGGRLTAIRDRSSIVVEFSRCLGRADVARCEARLRMRRACRVGRREAPDPASRSPRSLSLILDPPGRAHDVGNVDVSCSTLRGAPAGAVPCGCPSRGDERAAPTREPRAIRSVASGEHLVAVEVSS